MKCTNYTRMDTNEENFIPCHCPVCGGFLKWIDDEPICNKCKTELYIIPEIFDGEELPFGKICKKVTP